MVNPLSYPSIIATPSQAVQLRSLEPKFYNLYPLDPGIFRKNKLFGVYGTKTMGTNTKNANIIANIVH